MGPHCAPSLPPCPLCSPCGGQGALGNLVSLAAQRLFSNHYSGISVLHGREMVAACPAKDLAVDKTFRRWEDSCSIFWLLGAPLTPSQNLRADPRGVWGQAKHLLERSGLPPLPPKAVGGNLKREESSIHPPAKPQPRAPWSGWAQRGLRAPHPPHSKVNTMP